jgi:hypothetical protein
MREEDKIITDRIAAKHCPICDKELGKEIKLVQDIKFGVVEICTNHVIQGEEYVM